MTRRYPRLNSTDQPVLIFQRATAGTIVFPTTKHYCRFLRRLARVKRRFGCDVLAYAVLPRSIWLILRPCGHDISKAAHSLFISAAKTLRCNDPREKGCVFSGRFESRILKNEYAVRQAMGLLAKETRAATSLIRIRWPFTCVDGREDRFRICRRESVRHDQRDIPGSYLLNHGRPTLRWYLEAIGACRDLIEAVLNKLS